MVKVGPIEDEVEFIVLDIPATFSLLLGRPWFHKLEGVPSTLHQMIKFLYGEGTVTIEAETGNAVDTLEVQPFTRFQLAVIFEEWVDPKVAKIMEKMDYKPNTGLGAKGQRITPSLISKDRPPGRAMPSARLGKAKTERVQADGLLCEGQVPRGPRAM